MGTDLGQTLRAAAAGEGPSLRRGLWVTYLGSYGLEVAVGGGAVDWLGVDLQHGDLEVRDVPGLLRVAERVGLPLLTRVPSHDAAVVARVLDAGVDGVIVPVVDTAEQAAALVAAAWPPPRGARSTGSSRSALGVTGDPSPPVLLPMVETAAGLRHAAEILAVPGVDGVFVGPYDLTISCGFPDPSSPETLAALGDVVALSREAGKVVGFMAGTPALVGRASTADLVAVDTDVAALRTGLTQLLR
jgi:2-keto-3-deoxy-L-rhamnonate aldolase RhmA